jgi:hypothetical protein
MTRVGSVIVACLVAVVTGAEAQTPRPAPAREPSSAQRPAPPLPPDAPPPPGTPPRLETPPAAPRSPAPPGRAVNMRLDVTIIDEGGPQASRKTLSVTLADGQSGQVRASVFVPPMGPVPLALDAHPTLERDGKIRARITLEYQPNPRDPKEPMPATMRLSFGIVLENGQKIVAAQAADPVTDRRVMVEVTATILK